MSHRDVQYLILIFETNCFDHLKFNLALAALVLAVSSKISVLFLIAHTLPGGGSSVVVCTSEIVGGGGGGGGGSCATTNAKVEISKTRLSHMTLS